MQIVAVTPANLELAREAFGTVHDRPIALALALYNAAGYAVEEDHVVMFVREF